MIVQTVFLSFFSAFIASMPSKVMIIVIQVMILGINMFWALHSHYNPRLAARAKKDSESGPNSVFYCNPWLRSNIFASYPRFSVLKRCHKIIHSLKKKNAIFKL